MWGAAGFGKSALGKRAQSVGSLEKLFEMCKKVMPADSAPAVKLVMPPGSAICNLKDVPVDKRLQREDAPSLRDMVRESIGRCGGDGAALRHTLTLYVTWQARVRLCGLRIRFDVYVSRVTVLGKHTDPMRRGRSTNLP